MSVFGWSLPPGCSTLPGEEDCMCALCGKDAGDCDCPECPICSIQGDVRCFTERGHMEFTDEQRERVAAVQKQWEEEARRDYEYEKDLALLLHKKTFGESSDV